MPSKISKHHMFKNHNM